MSWTETPSGSDLMDWEAGSWGWSTYGWCRPSSPAQGTWYDLDSVVEDVLARLRLADTDVDEPRIRSLVPSAATLINNELDRRYPMTMASGVDSEDLDEDEDVAEALGTNVTPNILDALARLTIELYRRGRSDVNGNFPFETGPAIDVVVGELAGAKSRFGIA